MHLAHYLASDECGAQLYHLFSGTWTPVAIEILMLFTTKNCHWDQVQWCFNHVLDEGNFIMGPALLYTTLELSRPVSMADVRNGYV